MRKLITITFLSLVLLTSLAFALNPALFLPILLPTTVSVAACRVEHSCDGSDTTFDFTFPIIATSDMVVLHRVDSTGVETVLTETTHYSLSATNNDYSSGGTVTTVSTYASGITLVLLRDIPESQGADLEDLGVLRLEAIEAALDRLALIDQQHQEELDRCLKYPRSDTSSLSSEIPNSVDRASMTLIFDSSSEPDVE